MLHTPPPPHTPSLLTRTAPALSLAGPGGAYHYHTEPKAGCVYTDTAGAHSPIFAVMADGIPLFGAYGDNGVVPTNLDECGGHIDATYGFYHVSTLAEPHAHPAARQCSPARTHARTHAACAPPGPHPAWPHAAWCARMCAAPVLYMCDGKWHVLWVIGVHPATWHLEEVERLR